MARKEILIIAGPNGAGKTTFARTYLEQGGHEVPEDVVRRRFEAGLRNLRELYCEAVDEWVLFDGLHFSPVPVGGSDDLATSATSIAPRI